jgi:chitinase
MGTKIIVLALFSSMWMFVEGGSNVTSMYHEHYHRMLPKGIQNMCGGSYSDALGCGAPCPGGTNEECPAGQMCYAEIECPLPPTISPQPTRSPVKGFNVYDRLDKEIIGYYASWQWYDRSKLAKPENMDFRKVTRVNFAFFQIDVDGNIWGTDDWADPRVLFGDVNNNAGSCTEGAPGCKCSWVKPTFKSCNYHNEGMGLISRVHGAGKEIWPSIGGWTLSDNFPAMAKNPSSRKKFADNCVGLIKDYGFDGIDIDWEYPGYAEHSGTPDDIVSYPLLMEELRNALDRLEEETGKHYGITAALPCGPSHLENINVPELSKYLSELNLMTYDFHGAWDSFSGVNSPLYDSVHDPEPGWSVDGCVRNWSERGAPKEKMNIGLGFYGRSFLNAKALHEPHGGADDKTWAVDEGTPQYFVST